MASPNDATQSVVIFNRLALTAILLLLIATILTACFKTNQAAKLVPSSQPANNPVKANYSTTIPSFSHIFLIVLENKEADDIASNAVAPYLNQLATQYAMAANYHAIQHPSLPNYMALTGGDTFGITNDCIDCFVNSDNLANQITQAGHSWKAYMEDMPKPCFVGNAKPSYRQKHNPFIYYDNVRNDPTLCNNIVPFTQLAHDLQANTLPDFVWITPNMCNDMHDCAIEKGDTWLKEWVPQILASPAWRDDGVLFITFDEGTGSDSCCTYAQGGQVYTLVISPLVQPGFTSKVAYDHYSLLRTIEEAWRLPLLDKASCACTLPMNDFFVQSQARRP